MVRPTATTIPRGKNEGLGTFCFCGWFALCAGLHRLGLDEEFIDILGQNVTRITIPVRPGRDFAMILEVAAKNFRQKRMGYNAAQALNEKLLERAKENSLKNEKTK